MFICFKSPTIKAPLNLGLDFTGGTQIIVERNCNDDCFELNTRDIAQRISSLTTPIYIQFIQRYHRIIVITNFLIIYSFVPSLHHHD